MFSDLVLSPRDHPDTAKLRKELCLKKVQQDWAQLEIYVSPI